MIVERGIDCGALYDAERQGLVTLVRSLSDDQRETTVPATPDWSVRDVLAHVIGIAADLNAGDFGTADPDDWTARQVAQRQARSIEDLAQEWDAEAPTFTRGLALLGYEVGSHFVGDLVQHVSDVHHALGLPRRGDDGDAVVVALDFYLNSFHQTLLDAGIGTVVVVASGDRWLLGTGPELAMVTGGRFELLRALGGRRSARQITALDWTGDVDGVLPFVSRYGLPGADLHEH